MSKRIISTFMTLVMVLSIVACASFTTNAAKKKAQKITGVSSSYSKNVKAKNFTLKAKAKTKLTFTSSNKSVATVTKKGVVDVKKVGTATITIKAKATSKYKAATKKVKIYVGNVTMSVKPIISDSDNGLVAFFKNYYTFPVEVKATAVYYDDNGKMLKTESDSLYCLGGKEKSAVKFNGPEDEDYNIVPYARYKVTYTATAKNDGFTTYTSFGSKIKITSNKSTESIVAEVKNTSKNSMSYNAYFSIVFYDENKNVIGYRFTSPDPSIQNGSSTGYFEVSYPYSYEIHEYIEPASYEIFVNSAYSYKFNR